MSFDVIVKQTQGIFFLHQILSVGDINFVYMGTELALPTCPLLKIDPPGLTNI